MAIVTSSHVVDASKTTVPPSREGGVRRVRNGHAGKRMLRSMLLPFTCQGVDDDEDRDDDDEYTITLLNRTTTWANPARDPLEVVSSLLQQMQALYDAAENTGRSSGGEGMIEPHRDALIRRCKDLPEYVALMRDTAELQKVNVKQLADSAQHKFYLKLFNLLCMHASILFDGAPLDEVMDPTKLACKVGYDIGGCTRTVAGIEELMQELETVV